MKNRKDEFLMSSVGPELVRSGVTEDSANESVTSTLEFIIEDRNELRS